VDERNNTPTNPEWAKTLKPGWQYYRNRNFTALLDGVRVEGDEVGDKWTSPLKKLGDLLNNRSSDLSGQEKAALAEIADFQKMNDIRTRVLQQWRSATAEGSPWFGQWCKRPTNDEYLPPLTGQREARGHEGKGVDRVTEHGVVVDGASTKWTA
jgi:hypothetical protein